MVHKVNLYLQNNRIAEAGTALRTAQNYAEEYRVKEQERQIVAVLGGLLSKDR